MLKIVNVLVCDRCQREEPGRDLSSDEAPEDSLPFTWLRVSVVDGHGDRQLDRDLCATCKEAFERFLKKDA